MNEVQIAFRYVFTPKLRLRYRRERARALQSSLDGTCTVKLLYLQSLFTAQVPQIRVLLLRTRDSLLLGLTGRGAGGWTTLHPEAARGGAAGAAPVHGALARAAQEPKLDLTPS